MDILIYFGEKSNLMRIFYGILMIMAVLSGCNPNTNSTTASVQPVSIEKQSSLLPSWNDGKAKSDILNFVNQVTDPSSKSYVPVADRIATFDNDGTLWSEQPVYFQLAFALNTVKKMVAQDPQLKKDPLYRAVVQDDMEVVLDFGEEGLLKILALSHTGLSTAQYKELVTDWAQTATHPKTGKRYPEMIFQPMLELIEYLKKNDFKVFIVSGGGSDFMRPWAVNTYGVESDRIIGTTMKLEYTVVDDQPRLQILPELGFNNDKEAKPMAIHQYIGKKPIIAVGNSDGDLQMLQWTDSNEYTSLPIYVHHTDAVREWSYDRQSIIGRLDEGLDQAKENGWTIIDMQQDWNVIYPFDKKDP